MSLLLAMALALVLSVSLSLALRQVGLLVVMPAMTQQLASVLLPDSLPCAMEWKQVSRRTFAGDLLAVGRP